MDAEVVDRDQVGVVERAGDAGLVLEAAHQVGTARQRLVHHLEGDVSSEPGVARPVDLGHATRAEDGKYLVWTEPDSGRQAHRPSLTERPKSLDCQCQARRRTLPKRLSHRVIRAAAPRSEALAPRSR